MLLNEVLKHHNTKRNMNAFTLDNLEEFVDVLKDENGKIVLLIHEEFELFQDLISKLIIEDNLIQITVDRIV